MQASRPFAAGEQVFISYGTDQTVDSLLQFYGFVEAAPAGGGSV